MITVASTTSIITTNIITGPTTMNTAVMNTSFSIITATTNRPFSTTAQSPLVPSVAGKGMGVSGRNWAAAYLTTLLQCGGKAFQGGAPTSRGVIEARTYRGNLPFSAPLARLSLLGQFAVLFDVAAVDCLDAAGRFMVKYLFFSPQYLQRFTLVTYTTETLPIASLTAIYRADGSLFPGANWLEREVWDMFGIYFTANSDIRRILTDYGFAGHPLRKDFPLSGFLECLFSDLSGRLIYRNVVLSQEFRVYHTGIAATE